MPSPKNPQAKPKQPSNTGDTKVDPKSLDVHVSGTEDITQSKPGPKVTDLGNGMFRVDH